jgi:heme/copper-type cytochrome/quinol oxidase subunit 1
MDLSGLPLAGISVTLFLWLIGFAVLYAPGEADEERSEWFKRRWLGYWLIASGAVSLVLTIIVAFE